MMKKLCAFQKKIFPQNVRLTCTKKFWQAWHNFVHKNTKKVRELQKCWSYKFLNNFFHQRWFISNGECNFDKACKNFSLKIHRVAAQIPKTTQKKRGIFRKDNKIPQNVPMYMYDAVVTTLPKIFCQNSEKILLDFRKWGKIIKPSKKLICKNLRLNMYNEFLTSFP